jgi:hypothetical protein
LTQNIENRGVILGERRIASLVLGKEIAPTKVWQNRVRMPAECLNQRYQRQGESYLASFVNEIRRLNE